MQLCKEIDTVGIPDIASLFSKNLANDIMEIFDMFILAKTQNEILKSDFQKATAFIEVSKKLVNDIMNIFSKSISNSINFNLEQSNNIGIESKEWKDFTQKIQYLSMIFTNYSLDKETKSIQVSEQFENIIEDVNGENCDSSQEVNKNYMIDDKINI